MGIIGCGGYLFHYPVNLNHPSNHTPSHPSVLGERLVVHLNDVASPPITDFVLVDE